jgi:hypothetical protein
MHAILVVINLSKHEQGMLHRYHMCTEDHLEILPHFSPLLLAYIKSTPAIITSKTHNKNTLLWRYFDGLSATC